MKQATWNTIVTIEYVGFGVGLLAIPIPMMKLFDMGLDHAGALVARILGSAIIGAGINLWGSENRNSEAIRQINLGNLFYNFSAFSIILFATLSKMMGPLGWVAVIVHLLFSIGFGYFGLLKKS